MRVYFCLFLQISTILMAQEKPQMWANTKTRYWYLHHIHHKVKHKWRDAKDFVGDSWHARKGFTGAPKACEGFVHHKELGQVARLTHFF